MIGLSLPNLCKRYVHDGVVQAVVLWNTRSGLSDGLRGGACWRQGKMRQGPRCRPGGWGISRCAATQMILGNPLIFNKENIDQFDF